MSNLKIGVLALQGAFREHLQTLDAIGVEGVPVRLPEDLENVSGLILPGGESTTMRHLIGRWGLAEPIKALAATGAPGQDRSKDKEQQEGDDDRPDNLGDVVIKVELRRLLHLLPLLIEIGPVERHRRDRYRVAPRWLNARRGCDRLLDRLYPVGIHRAVQHDGHVQSIDRPGRLDHFLDRLGDLVVRRGRVLVVLHWLAG